jgi:hypothetical protein
MRRRQGAGPRYRDPEENRPARPIRDHGSHAVLDPGLGAPDRCCILSSPRPTAPRRNRVGPSSATAWCAGHPVLLQVFDWRQERDTAVRHQVRSGLRAGGRWIRTLGPPVGDSIFSRPPRNPATRNRPVTRTGFLTIDTGRFTVRRARLAPAMISTPGHRASRRRQRGALPAWSQFGLEPLDNRRLRRFG